MKANPPARDKLTVLAVVSCAAGVILQAGLTLSHPRVKSLPLLVALTSAFPLLTGCMCVLPIPSSQERPETGRPLAKQEIQFIVPHSTSWTEVTNRLGCSFRKSPRLDAYAFPWERPGGRGIWLLAHTEGGGAGEFEWSRWRALFVLRSDRDVVTAVHLEHLDSQKSVDEQLELWAVKEMKRAGMAIPPFFPN